MAHTILRTIYTRVSVRFGVDSETKSIYLYTASVELTVCSITITIIVIIIIITTTIITIHFP